MEKIAKAKCSIYKVDVLMGGQNASMFNTTILVLHLWRHNAKEHQELEQAKWLQWQLQAQ